jgi:hypothetical protein
MRDYELLDILVHLKGILENKMDNGQELSNIEQEQLALADKMILKEMQDANILKRN